MIGMITINLLPAEKRRAEKTPLSRFIVLIVGIIILSCAAGGFAYFRFSVLKFAIEEKQDKEREQANAIKHHEEYKALIKLQDQFKQRGDTIKGIREGRIAWGVKLMQFYDFFIMDEFREVAWIDGLSMEIQDKARASRAPAKGQVAAEVPAGSLDFTLNVVGDDWVPISNFRMTMRGERGTAQDIATGVAFWKDFLALSDPGATKETDREKDPPIYYTEDITVDIKGRKPPEKKKAAAAPAATPAATGTTPEKEGK